MTDPRVRFTAAEAATRSEYERHFRQRSRTVRAGETCPGAIPPVPVAVGVRSCDGGPSRGHEWLPMNRGADRRTVDRPLTLHDDA